MSSFLSSTNINSITGAYMRLWETVSAFRNVIVHKSPIQVIAQVNTPVYAGYGNESTPSNVTYTPVSGVYPVAVIINKTNQTLPLNELHTNVDVSQITIKVTEAAKNYIEQGKTERFEIDGISYNGDGVTTVENYYGLKFYTYQLNKIK